MGVMHEADDAYSIRSTWSCYWLDQFLTLALNILILSIFYMLMDLSTNYFVDFSGCLASFVCSCHSILECCVTFSGVKLNIRSFVLLLSLFLLPDVLRLPNKLNNTPYIPYFQCEVNTGKLLNCLSSGAYNLKAIKSSCNLKTDLNKPNVGHSSDMIFVSLAKLFNKNSKL